jgi:hypothetical protein
MYKIGEYVLVELENEVRRGIVATEVENDHLEVVFLKDYGNTLTTEQIESDDPPPIAVTKVRRVPDGDRQPISSYDSIESLRERAAKFFTDTDWRGAICAYREILYRMEQMDKSHFFLTRVDNKIRVNQFVDSNSYVDYGVVDPSTLSQTSLSSEGLIVSPSPMNPNSLFRVFQPFHLHATTLLNLGRCLLKAGLIDESISSLSYALYTSPLSERTEASQLRSKCYFWRSRARLAGSQSESALRDSVKACEFADQATNSECEALSRNCRGLLNEQRKGMRIITRELMTLIDRQIKDGVLDFNIYME